MPGALFFGAPAYNGREGAKDRPSAQWPLEMPEAEAEIG
jgi:hypothetical protein